jgi:predicted PurR-regulated permease PerM
MNNQHHSRPQWSSTTKLVIVLLGLVVLGFFFYKFGAAVYPLVIAIILAYVLAPFVNLLQKKIRLPRSIAILLVYLLGFLILGTILWIIIPLFFSQVGLFIKDINIWIREAERFFSGDIVIAGYTVSGSILIKPITDFLQNMLEPILGSTLGVVAFIVESIAWIVFIVIISIYLIKESKSILAWFEHLIPPSGRYDYKYILNEANIIWSAFFRGQLLLAFLVSIIITVEGLILGLPFALLMGIFAGILEFLPSIGHGIWLVIASLLALILGSSWLPVPNWVFLIIVLSFHLIFTQFDLNYLIPRIIGRSVHLPPLVVIIGIIAGASFAGVLGVVLAAPAIASLRVLGGYLYARIFDLEPFQDKLTTVPPLPPPEIRWWQNSYKRKKTLIEDKE